MRHQHKTRHKRKRRALADVLSILSHVAAIIGTIVVILDALHHW